MLENLSRSGQSVSSSLGHLGGVEGNWEQQKLLIGFSFENSENRSLD